MDSSDNPIPGASRGKGTLAADLESVPSAEVDAVTRLPTYAAWRIQAQRFLDEVGGRSESCSLVLYDIDRLTDINRAGGPLAGDRALRALAVELRAHGDESMLGRYSDGRLVQILPGRVRAEALETADRVRIALEALQLGRIDGNRTAVTTSAGIAEFLIDARTLGDLCACAENALERAKREGRNRCALLPHRVLVWGVEVPLGTNITGLFARCDLTLIPLEPRSSLADEVRAQRPALVIVDALAPRNVLDALGEQLRRPESSGTRVVLVTASGPEPSHEQIASRLPNSQLVMGATGLQRRLEQAIVRALGIRLRRCRRTTVRLPARVELIERGHFARGMVLDVSASGARVALAESVVTGEQLALELLLREQPLRLLCQVVRTTSGSKGSFEIGVNFQSPTVEQTKLLKEIVDGRDEERPSVRAVPAVPEKPTCAAAEVQALNLVGVSREFGVFKALHDVSLQVKAGERIAIIGPSGAGKSTLLRLLNTSLMATRGRVEILGSDLGRVSPRELRRLRTRIGTVYQQLLLVPQASVLQNVVAGSLGRVSLARALVSLLSSTEADKVAAVLDQVGLAGKIYERVDHLSGGEQQRVAIAKVLYQKPEVLIADEPLASVDPARSAEIVDLLLAAGHGRTLVVSTHQLEPVIPYFPRVVGIKAGTVLFDKAKTDLTLDDLAKLYESDQATRAPRHSFAGPPSAGRAKARLVIGASNTPGEFILPRVIPAFLRECSAVKLTLAIKASRDVTDDLLSGHVDIAFVGARVPHPDLQFEDFTDDEIVLVASPYFSGLPPEPLPPSLVARLLRVERDSGSGTRTIVEDHFSNMGIPLNPSSVVFEAGGLMALKSAAMAGVGVAFASRLSVQEELASGRLREVAIEGVKIPRRVFVSWNRALGQSSLARRFLEVAHKIWVPRQGSGDPNREKP